MEAARHENARAAVAQTVVVASLASPVPSPVASPVAGAPSTGKRKRRTKAEMEAARMAGLAPPAKTSVSKNPKPASDASSGSESDADDTPLAEL
jgi:hypothetical protein